MKSLSALFRGITSKHVGNVYCLNCFHSYSTEKKLIKHYKVFKNNDCYIEIPNKDNKILKYNHGEKLMKHPFIIYADLLLMLIIYDCLLEKMRTCHNNPEKPPTAKINMHTSSGYSLFIDCSFVSTKNKINSYRSKGCMKRVCKDLKSM